MDGLTVTIPVGPQAHHRRWLGEALESVRDQHPPADEILLIDDSYEQDLRPPMAGVRIHRAGWRLGLVAAFNLGVAHARNGLVLFLGSDDRLLPGAIAACWEAWRREREELGFYYLGVQYSDGRQQNTACHAAMVTKALWKYSGGFPPECAVGACDHIFLSALIAAADRGLSRARVLKVSEQLLYWHRLHDESETATSGPARAAIAEVRNRMTETWVPRQ